MSATIDTPVGYSLDVIADALAEVVAAGGNCAKAHRALAETMGSDAPSERSLRDWKNDTHREQYRNLETVFTDEAEQTVISLARKNAGEAAETVALAIARAKEDLQNGKCRDPAQTALNLSKTMGLSVQEVLRLSGRPTEITASMTMSQTVVTLLAEGILKPPPGMVYNADTGELEPETGTTGSHA